MGPKKQAIDNKGFDKQFNFNAVQVLSKLC